MPLSPHDLEPLLPRLRARARRLARPGVDPDDLVQEALLKVWARAQAGGEIALPHAYLFATLARLAARSGPELSQADPDTLAGPEAGISAVTAREVFAAIEALPPREAVLLRSVATEGLSPADLAARYGLPPGTVMSRLARGRARLAGALGLTDGDRVSQLLGE